MSWPQRTQVLMMRLAPGSVEWLNDHPEEHLSMVPRSWLEFVAVSLSEVGKYELEGWSLVSFKKPEKEDGNE